MRPEMAARPLHLFEAGVVTEQQFVGLGEAPGVLAPLLADRLGCEKRVRIPFNPRDRWLTAAREACRTLADGVLASLREGAGTAVIGGECTLVAGALSGALGADPEISLVYFDAHGDFNTLATTPSHYVSGMVLAHLCGRSVAPLLFPGSRRIAEERVALVGARALDGGERGNLDRSRVLRIAFAPDHAADHAECRVRRLAGPTHPLALGRRERRETRERGSPCFGKGDPQIQLAALSGVRRIAHRLQGTDQRVDVALVRCQDVQKDVVKGASLRWLGAKSPVVDPLHKGEQILARPLEPPQIASQIARGQWSQVRWKDRLSGEETLGVVLGDARPDRFVRVDLLAVALEVPKVRTDRVGCRRHRLVGRLAVRDAA